MRYYMIPVDRWHGYLNIKAGYSPYTHQSWFCGGCPQTFGGNDDNRTILATLAAEAFEESHGKLTIVENMRHFTRVYQSDDRRMTFWICDKFNLSSIGLPRTLLRPVHKETTGEILKIDFSKVPTSDTRATANHILQMYHRSSGGRRPRPVHIAEFQTSETAKAIRQAAIVLQRRHFAVLSPCVLL